MSENITMTVQPARIIHDSDVPQYTGDYTVTPSFENDIVLETSGKQCIDNITVLKAETNIYEGTYTVVPTKDTTILATQNKMCTNDIMVEPIPSEYIIPSGTITINNNDTYDVSSYANAAVEVISPLINLQQKMVNPTTQQQHVTPDQGYAGLSEVIVNAAQLGSKTATPSGQQQIIEPDSPDIGLSSVTVEPVHLQAKTATPATQQQTITPDSPNVGLSEVTVEPALLQTKTATNIPSFIGKPIW